MFHGTNITLKKERNNIFWARYGLQIYIAHWQLIGESFAGNANHVGWKATDLQEAKVKKMGIYTLREIDGTWKNEFLNGYGWGKDSKFMSSSHN